MVHNGTHAAQQKACAAFAATRALQGMGIAVFAGLSRLSGQSRQVAQARIGGAIGLILSRRHRPRRHQEQPRRERRAWRTRSDVSPVAQAAADGRAECCTVATSSGSSSRSPVAEAMIRSQARERTPPPTAWAASMGVPALRSADAIGKGKGHALHHRLRQIGQAMGTAQAGKRPRSRRDRSVASARPKDRAGS